MRGDEAQARYDKAKACEVELRVAKLEGKPMETEETIEIVDEMCGLPGFLSFRHNVLAWGIEPAKRGLEELSPQQ